MRRDILSAYAASGAKVLSWVIVSAIVFRADAVQYAILALIRGTIGLLNYTSLGLAPAVVRLVTEVRHKPLPLEPVRAPDPGEDEPVAGDVARGEQPTLGYARPRPRVQKAEVAFDPIRAVYANAIVVAAFTSIAGLILSLFYAGYATDIHNLRNAADHVGEIAMLMSMGVVMRLASEPSAALLQVNGRIATDNKLLVGSEIVWVAFTVIGALESDPVDAGRNAAGAFLISGAVLAIARAVLAGQTYDARRAFHERFLDRTILRRLLSFGLLVTVAQLADFLYAPTDYILINRLISVDAVAIYAPAVQIDAGLLLLVSALGAVLLPKAAIAHAAGQHDALRRYYVRGTLGSAALLLCAAALAYVLSPWIFRFWLGNPLPQTQAILPVVLINTVLGGSSGVGRAILLGIGKVKPFAVATLLAGAVNVVASYVFVRYAGLGLNGIIYGTVIAVVGRCLLWQPWYVMRTLERESQTTRDESMLLATPSEPL